MDVLPVDGRKVALHVVDRTVFRTGEDRTVGGHNGLIKEVGIVFLYYQRFYRFMCFYVKRESHPSSVVNALLITIEQYRNAEVCLDYVAGQLFINSNYLSGLISRSIGISFHSFVRLLRVSFAQEMLKNTRNYSMEAIGYKSGFSNTNMFFRTFRDITGITPKNYRTGGK